MYAGYRIPSSDNGNCYSYRSFKINPIPFDGYITIKFEDHFMFNIQVCDSGIARIQSNNQYASFGAWYGAHIIIPVAQNPIETIVITADVKITQPPCVSTKGWNINAYNVGYRVIGPNGKAIWGPANPPHCSKLSWYKNSIDNTDNDDKTGIDTTQTIPCYCPIPIEPSPYPKPSSLNYYSSGHVGVL